MKRLLWNIVYLLGLIDLWIFFNRRSISILMLHGVVESDEFDDWKPSWKRLNPEWLGQCLEFLSKKYHFISLSEAIGMLSGRLPIINNCMVLTFDDGYRNNLTTALPILNQYAISPCFYIVPARVEDQSLYWIDRLDYALHQMDVAGRVFVIDGLEISVPTNQRSDRDLLHLRIRKACKERLSDEELHQWVDDICIKIEQELGKRLFDKKNDNPFSAILSWHDIQQCRARGAEVGSHTLSHCRLTRADPDNAKYEIIQSKIVIEEKSHFACEHFCYPNGDFDIEIARMVRDAGYQSAVTCIQGLNRKGDDLFTLKRLSFPREDMSKGELFAHVSNMRCLISR